MIDANNSNINEKKLLVDIDIPYDIFMDKLYLLWLDKLNFCLKQFNNNVLYINVRESQSNNTHIYVFLEKEIRDFDTYLQFKFCLNEDHGRLTHDIRRYKKLGKVLQFFWINKKKQK